MDQDRLIFVIGPPRSGSTLLQRMLGSHPDIHTRPEPHIVTPLAHLGFWANVDQAPYDHLNAAEALREFVADLPRGDEDYYAACRAYTDGLYGPLLEASGKRMLLDKTPAYALVLPFLARLYPDAHYIVLTRHPLAVLVSYANSFFEGDLERAVAFNDILGRYVPAIAEFLRARPVAHLHHVRYEQLVQEPEDRLAEIFAVLGLPDAPDAVNYGAHEHVAGSYGDPKVVQSSRPTTASLERWAADLAHDAGKRALAERVVGPLLPEDVAAWGFDRSQLFAPVDGHTGAPPRADRRWAFNRYRLQRAVFLALRQQLERRAVLRHALRRVRYYCDVLLRE